MTTLRQYVANHTERGACQCGKCFDAPEKPEEQQPTGHTADMVFFKVSAKAADAETLKELVRSHKGEFCSVDLFDGKEHNYIELGRWIGDQGTALQLMGLGSLLGLWKLLTPKTMLGPMCDEVLAQQMAGAGMVAVQSVG